MLDEIAVKLNREAELAPKAGAAIEAAGVKMFGTAVDDALADVQPKNALAGLATVQPRNAFTDIGGTPMPNMAARGLADVKGKKRSRITMRKRPVGSGEEK